MKPTSDTHTHKLLSAGNPGKRQAKSEWVHAEVQTGPGRNRYRDEARERTGRGHNKNKIRDEPGRVHARTRRDPEKSRGVRTHHAPHTGRPVDITG